MVRVQLVRSLAAMVAGIWLAGCSTAPTPPPVPAGTVSTLEQVYGDLLRARTATEFYVRNVRRQAPAGSSQLIEAERLYEEARGSVNAWLVDLQSMVRNGTPITEQLVDARRKTASEAVVAFNTYADQVLRPTGAASEPGAKDAKFLPALTLDGVIGLGRALWDETNKRRQANREAYDRWAQGEVQRLEKSQWQSFGEVK